MSNFIIGIVVGFFLCVWALDASPVTAAISLVDRVRQVQVSFAAEHEAGIHDDAIREDEAAPHSSSREEESSASAQAY